MFDRLVRMIEDFEKSLSDEEEIGGRLVGAPGEGSFHIDDIGFWGPDLIMFYGKNHYGRPVRLIQHYTQLSVLLTSMPKEKEKPRRIGFASRTPGERGAAAAARRRTAAGGAPSRARRSRQPRQRRSRQQAARRSRRLEARPCCTLVAAGYARRWLHRCLLHGSPA